MKIIVTLFFQIILIFIFVMSDVQADGGHGSDTRKKPRKTFSPLSSLTDNTNDQSIKGKLLGVLYVDDFELSVKIADVKDSVPDGGSHNVLVKIKLGDMIQRNAKMKIIVLFPDNTRKSKTSLVLGDWYLAGYDMDQKGKHQILISFRNKNGKKHSTEISYP